MIVTSRFVFLHLHKSGGTFINQCLLRFLPDAKFIGYHLPAALIPPEYEPLPRLGFVRSPWSYYVSWYTFQRSRPTPNALFTALSANETLDFKQTIRNMVLLGSDDATLERVLRALPADYTGQGLNLPAFALAGIRGTGRGFYSFLYGYMFGTSTNLHVGKMESLRTDLPRLLAQFGTELPSALQEFIAQSPRLNTSTHEESARYYDPELADLVARRDAEIVDRHGYVLS